MLVSHRYQLHPHCCCSHDTGRYHEHKKWRMQFNTDKLSVRVGFNKSLVNLWRGALSYLGHSTWWYHNPTIFPQITLVAPANQLPVCYVAMPPSTNKQPFKINISCWCILISAIEYVNYIWRQYYYNLGNHSSLDLCTFMHWRYWRLTNNRM